MARQAMIRSVLLAAVVLCLLQRSAHAEAVLPIEPQGVRIKRLVSSGAALWMEAEGGVYRSGIGTRPSQWVDAHLVQLGNEVWTVGDLVCGPYTTAETKLADVPCVQLPTNHREMHLLLSPGHFLASDRGCYRLAAGGIRRCGTQDLVDLAQLPAEYRKSVLWNACLNARSSGEQIVFRELGTIVDCKPVSIYDVGQDRDLKLWLATNIGLHAVEKGRLVSLQAQVVGDSPEFLRRGDTLWLFINSPRQVFRVQYPMSKIERRLPDGWRSPGKNRLQVLDSREGTVIRAGREILRLRDDELIRVSSARAGKDDAFFVNIQLAGDQIWLESNPEGKQFFLPGNKPGDFGKELNQLWVLQEGKAIPVFPGVLPSSDAPLNPSSVFATTDGRTWYFNNSQLFLRSIECLHEPCGRPVALPDNGPHGMEGLPLFAGLKEGAGEFARPALRIHTTAAGYIFQVYEKVLKYGEYQEQLRLFLLPRSRLQPNRGDAPLQLIEITDPRIGYFVMARDAAGESWFGAATGVYRLPQDNVTNGATLALLGGPLFRLYSTEIAECDHTVCFATNMGAFRLERDVDVQLDIKPVSSLAAWFQKKLLPVGYVFSGPVNLAARYVRKGGSDNTISPLAAQPNFEYSPVGLEDFRHGTDFFLPWGRITVRWQVKDYWGNVFSPVIEGYALPDLVILLPCALALSLLAVIVLVLMLAPFLGSARRLAAAGPIRWAAQTLLRVTSYRVLFLRHYLWELHESHEFGGWRARYVPADRQLTWLEIASLLADKKQVLMFGPSGVGKTVLMRYLVAVAAGAHGKIQGKRVIPVFLQLSMLRGTGISVLDIVVRQFARLGDLDNPLLVRTLLDHGGLLLLCDGLNEIDEEIRKSLYHFIENFCNRNWFVVTSQQDPNDFNWPARVELSPLDNEHIKRYVQRRKGHQAEVILERFTPQTWELCRLPQDLELLLECIAELVTLPNRFGELYECTLNPIFKEFRNNGDSDYESTLTRRAYEMVCTGSRIIDIAEDPVFNNKLNLLVPGKFVNQLGTHYHFRHDRLRAWLAARYFFPRWADLLNKNSSLNGDWQTMLEFTLDEMKNTGSDKKNAGKLLLAVLRADCALASKLYHWLRRARPDLIGPWEEDFQKRYGAERLDADYQVAGEQRRRLREALVGGFPSETLLAMLLRDRMDLPLVNITTANGMMSKVEDLIVFMEARGSLMRLVRAAREQNPDYLALKDIAAEMGIP